MKRSVFLFTTTLLLGVCSNLYSQNKASSSVKDTVGDKYYSQLIKDGKIVVTHEDGKGNLKLIPQSIYAGTIKSNLIEKKPKHFYYTYEALYYLPKTISVQKSSEIARSISKMTEINYYSNTRRKVIPLYKKAFMIDNEKSTVAIADNNAGNCDGKTYYCLMDDASFGETRYKLTYSQSERELLTVFTNTDDLGLGPIRAIMPQDLVINLLIQDCGDGMVVYLCADLDSKKMPGVRGKITVSMTARMDAISGWFASKM